MILGLNVYHGDSSVVALQQTPTTGHSGSASLQGVAGLEEERLRREKHWAGFPAQALALLAGGDGPIEAAAVGRKPGAHPPSPGYGGQASSARRCTRSRGARGSRRSWSGFATPGA